MTDTSNIDTPLTRTARSWLAGIGLAFCFTVIIYVTLWGRSDNSLHASSLSWAWTGMILILGGLGFGALAPYVLPNLVKK